jgi:hypothetical protein
MVRGLGLVSRQLGLRLWLGFATIRDRVQGRASVQVWSWIGRRVVAKNYGRGEG